MRREVSVPAQSPSRLWLGLVLAGLLPYTPLANTVPPSRNAPSSSMWETPANLHTQLISTPSSTPSPHVRVFCQSCTHTPKKVTCLHVYLSHWTGTFLREEGKTKLTPPWAPDGVHTGLAESGERFRSLRPTLNPGWAPLWLCNLLAWPPP